MRELRIAIVGSSKSGDSSYEQVKQLILSYPSNTTIISGGAIGVDSIAEKVANELGYEFECYRPKGYGWKFFKERNLLIAERVKKVYSLAIADEEGYCYHCEVQGHQKTAGCWTGKANGNYEVILI